MVRANLQMNGGNASWALSHPLGYPVVIIGIDANVRFRDSVDGVVGTLPSAKLSANADIVQEAISGYSMLSVNTHDSLARSTYASAPFTYVSKDLKHNLVCD